MRPRTRFRLNHRVPVLAAGRQERTTLATGGRKEGQGRRSGCAEIQSAHLCDHVWSRSF